MDVPPGQRLTIGRWRVDGSADEIEADGRVVKLEPQQMRLLLLLARRAGQVVLTQELLDEVWRDLVVTPSSVYQAVAQLRRQLGDTAAEPSYIQTVHRKGYRLVAPVAIDAMSVAPTLPRDTPVPTPTSSPAATSASSPLPTVPSASGAIASLAPAAAPATQAVPDPPASVDLHAVRDTTAVQPTAASGSSAGTDHSDPDPRLAKRRVLAAGMITVAALAGTAGWWISRHPLGPRAPPRLAVLPFRDLNVADQALARGLALDVIRALGRHADLVVLAPDSVLGLTAGQESKPGELAQLLGVQHLLLGSLQRQGSLLQLDLRLLDAGSSAERWQRRFERSPAVVSQLPVAIAGEVAAALSLPPLADERSQPGPSEAYELYVLGEDARRRRTPEAFEQARNYFQRGIDADPGFARNYVGLAWAWLGQATAGAGLALPQAVSRATPLFERALALESDAADAITGQAAVHQFAGESDTARRLLARALSLQPNYAQAHMTWGIVEFEDGWPVKAVAHFERATALNPLAPPPVERLALASLFTGQTDAAAQHFRRVIALDPRYPNGPWGLGMHGYAVGDLVQAVGGYRQALTLEPRRPYLWQELAWLYLDLQSPADAATAFARAIELLPDTDWLSIFASFAWVARRAGGASDDVPPALAQTSQASDRGGAYIDLCMARAMASLPLDADLLKRSLDVAAARGQWMSPFAWFVFQGWHRPLNLATVQYLLGQAQASAATLEEVERHLDALTRQGNRWPMLDFHRGRALALRGRISDSLTALERAVAAGARRGWWLRLDPALAALRGEPRFQRLLADIDQRVATQRQQLAL